MLSQTKMQLWYPKKPSEETSGHNSITFLNKYKKDDKQQTINNEDDNSPPLSDISDGIEELNVEYLSEDDSSRAPSLVASDCEDEVDIDKKRMKRMDDLEVSDFIDLEYWKRETICCGTIYKGMYDEILVDTRFFKPCENNISKRREKMD